MSIKFIIYFIDSFHYRWNSIEPADRDTHQFDAIYFFCVARISPRGDSNQDLTLG